jgi:type I restriction enzyme S subunit
MSEWTQSTVRSVVNHVASGPSPTCEERTASGSEWGLLKTTAATWGGWNESAHKVPPPEFWGQTRLEVQRDDVIITKAGPRHRVGVVVHVPSTRPGLMVSGKMVLLRPDPSKVVPRLLADALASVPSQKYLDDRTTGMAEAQTNFANSALLNTPIFLPPLEEQQRIAKILDTIDETIQVTERILAKLNSTRIGLLDELVERALGVDETPLSNAVADPLCYGIVQVGDHVPAGVPVVAIRDLGGDLETGLHRTDPAIDARYPRSRVSGGEVLLSIKGTIGRVGLVRSGFRGNISRDVALLRPLPEFAAPYLKLFLESSAGQARLNRISVGTTRAELSIHALRRVRVPRLDATDQLRIVDALEAIDRQRSATAAELGKLRRLRRGLAADLLSGRVRAVAA